MSGNKIFWMRQSLEHDFFSEDKDAYEKFLSYTSVLASAALGQVETPYNVLGAIKVSAIKKNVIKYAEDKLQDTVKDKLKDKVQDKTIAAFLDKAIVSGHGEVNKNKVTEKDVEKGWVELGKRAVLFLLSIPTGGSPIAGVLLLFPLLNLMNTVDKAKTHARYQEMIDSMMTKYENILLMASYKKAIRVQKEKDTANFGLDWNEDVSTEQDERVVFQGRKGEVVYSVTELQVCKTRSELTGLKTQSTWNKAYDPNNFSVADLARIYIPFPKSFTNLKAFDKKKEIMDWVDTVMKGKSGYADLNGLVPFQGTKVNVTDDEEDWSNNMDEATISVVPVFHK